MNRAVKPVKLSLATLDRLPGSVSGPRYQRSSLSPGILHIGVGNFHRSHQMVYMDRLFEQGRDLDWAIVGAGIKPEDAEQRRRLAAQDWLTTVVDLSADGSSARVIGSMVDFCEVRKEAIMARLADPAIRIVSLTITEGGYFIDATTGGFDEEHQEIRRDAEHPGDPQTVFGVLLAPAARCLRAGDGGGSAHRLALPRCGPPGRGAFGGMRHAGAPAARTRCAGGAHHPDSAGADRGGPVLRADPWRRQTRGP